MNIEFLTIRTIFENDNVKAKDISHLFTVDIKKVEDAIGKAINEGYIEKSGNYHITKKGIDYLSQYKVDNAVILACGKGVRLAPLTFDTPKCFIRIKGQKMIERQIEQLLTAGVNDITIMVGFMHEKFEYLKHKYGVELIYNEEYENKNTLSTFYHALSKIKNHNTYVCVSDVYMIDNIYHKYECENFYSGTFLHDLDKEWQYIRDDDNRITGVLDGGIDEYAMMGPSFLTKDFSDKLIPLILDAYNKEGTEQYYWENVLVENFSNLPPMYLYKQIKGSMFEFDKLEDVRLFDDDIKTGSFSFSYVADTFNVSEKEIKNIKCIKEGLTNRSYIFTIGDDNKQYICRVPGIGTNFFIDRKNEKKVYEKLDGKNITENIIAFDDDGVKISKFFENAKCVDINKENELKDAMLLYRKFHNLNIKVDKSCDLIDKINEYNNDIKNLNLDTSSYDNFEESLKKVQKLNEYKNKFNREKTLIHGDANPGNVLYTNDGIKLIDFEYAGMADPLVDISLFSIYVKFDIDKAFKLLEYYNGDTKGTTLDGEILDNVAMNNLSVEDAKNLVVCYMALGAFWCVLWVVCRDGLSKTDNSEYGNNMYNIFNESFSYLEKNKIIL